MNDEIKKAVQKSRASAQVAHPEQRAGFKALLLTNPNYFGNLAESPFKPILPLSGNTHYEELGCVGYHPQQERLEAVVYVYQPSGYGTGICGPGTPEYVRFYLSFDNGATWQDQGLTSFQAYDIPQGTDGSKRLEYAVSLKVDPKRKLCFLDQLIKTRAILSWNNPPPPHQPNWNPVWGNVRDAHIQVEPLRFIFPLDVLKATKVKLPPLASALFDFDEPIAVQPKTLDATQLATLYHDKGVPVHRFAFKELASFASGQTALSAEVFQKQFPGIEINPKIIDVLFPKTDGDVSYEELTCIGLDPNSPDTLIGILKIKKASGYSGGPCTTGSREYISWWADFDGNGSFETFLGSANVAVYDLTSIPPDGVFYAVRLPVDLSKHRRNCHEGPVVVRIRAILSWNHPVPGNNPNQVPTWGNREETLINIAPSASTPAGKIAILGGIPVSYIDSGSGLTTASAVFATNNLPPDAYGRACPFAGRVTVQGSPLLGFSYKVEVTPLDAFNNPTGAPIAVATNLTLTRFDGTTLIHVANPVTKQFAYLPFTDNVNSVLAQWDSGGDAKWQVVLYTYDGGGNLAGIDTHRIQLDNTGPDVSISILAGTGDCGKFAIGTLLWGNFVARDTYLGSYSLGVEPAVNPAGVGVPTPSSGIVNTAVLPGDNWSLDTTGMKPCGYVLRVVATDRAIINSQAVGHSVPDSVGFCLEDKSQEE